MASNEQQWLDQALENSRDLHDLLRIDERQWHQLKGNRRRRTAELFSAALVQLLSEGDSEDVAALTQQALGWIKGELKDPGCPHR